MRSLVTLLTTCRVNCLAALSKCSHLRHLDLSFVSESISMADLLRSISLLSKLESLRLRMFLLGFNFPLLDSTKDVGISRKHLKSPDMSQGWKVAL